jgi:DNA-binding response OmpR family regulator
MKYEILIIDDDTDLCILLKKYLELEGYAVTVCYDGKSGLDKLEDNNYHLIILDVMLPQINGFEVLANIRKKNNVPVLMLTAKDSEVDKVSGLRLGADDYLTKPFLQSEFVARVQSLIRRYTVFNHPNDTKQQSLSFKGIIINPAQRNVKLNGNNIQLTAKEFDLLYYLASHQGQVFTKQQIYNHVWQDKYAFDDNNIMSFISKLRKKIENKEINLNYIQTIHGVGYRFSQEA